MTQAIRILVVVPFRDRHMKSLREAAGDQAIITQAWPMPGESKLVELLRSADVVIGEPSPAALAQAPNVRLVQMTWAGTDFYTRGSLPFPKGMALCNVAGKAYGHIISQYVVGQIIAIAQNLPIYVRQQEREQWRSAGAVMSIEGATVLVFGAGDLGICTAQRLESFGVHSIGVCRDLSQARPPFESLVTLDRAEELLGRADVVVNCLPNTNETAKYLDERRLRMLKQGSILVNVGRGNFIDCEALARVLAEGRLRGAALDVTDPEPLPQGHPLWQEPRCVITPHEAGGAFGKCDGTEDRICEIACDNVRRLIANETLVHRVI